MAVIEVSDLRCTYGDHVAVDGIDFTVQRGEIFALLGANGAGKTTTLETLEGHQAPASGSVRLFGRDPRAQRRAVRRRTGVMLQDGGFAGELTVRETADLWASSAAATATSRPTSTGSTSPAAPMCPSNSSRAARPAGWRSRSRSTASRSC